MSNEDLLVRTLEFIKAHPGATPADIRANVSGFESDVFGKSVSVKYALNIWKRRGVIENRNIKSHISGNGPGQWYVVDNPENPGIFYSQRKRLENWKRQLRAMEKELKLLEESDET